MGERYETKEEAEKKVNEINESAQPIGYCPLMDAPCKTDCVCFEAARFIGQRKTKGGEYVIEGPYYVYGSHCGNMMFFRECQN